MRILGIDYGEKRIGLAVSDESRTFARELGIFHPKKFWQELPNIIMEHQVTAIALGLPLGVNGNDTEKTLEVREFKKKLEEISRLPVGLIDERFSTAMAKKLPGGRRNVDSLAAQIILQNYLDKIKI